MRLWVENIDDDNNAQEVRLPGESEQVIEAKAFLTRMTPAELVTEAIAFYARAIGRDPLVKDLLDIRAQHDRRTAHAFEVMDDDVA